MTHTHNGLSATDIFVLSQTAATATLNYTTSFMYIMAWNGTHTHTQTHTPTALYVPSINIVLTALQIFRNDK